MNPKRKYSSDPFNVPDFVPGKNFSQKVEQYRKQNASLFQIDKFPRSSPVEENEFLPFARFRGGRNGR